jgi:uncharacterized protein with HEPN domain
MPRPLDLVVEEMLDYIEQARGYVQDMTFEVYSSDQKTQRAVERCIEVISEASRHIPMTSKRNTPRSLGSMLPRSAIFFATSITTSQPALFGTR